jgi:hypothetical protein
MGLERPIAEQLPQTDQRAKTRQVFAKAVVATALLAGVIAGGVFYTSGSSLFMVPSGDDVSDADKTARQEAFNSLKFLSMSTVTPADIPRAVESMHLSPADQAKLEAAIGQTQVSAAPQADAVPVVAKPDAKAASAVATAAAEPAKASALEPAPAPAPALAVSKAPMTLAWVRLWDTDVEDGDVVRIDSQGYSRTVSLTNRGATFAIPVPASGQVRITGIRDGDGGGITVGLASGSAQAVLPIMSVGQVLTLNVRTN